jgi:hypothetical protein
METTDLGDRNDPPGGSFRDRSAIGRVFLEAQVRSTPMIVPAVRREDAPKMRLVDDDHVIETLSSDRADQAFDVRILSRTRRRGHDFGDAEADQSSVEDVAENAVAVTVQPAGRGVVRKASTTC